MVDIEKNPKLDLRSILTDEKLYTNNEKVNIGYARVSTDEQDVQSQIRLIKEKGVPDHLIFIDEATSGTKAPEKRPGWSQLLKFVNSGMVGTLYTFEVSRIGRTTSEAIKQILNLEQDAKVKVHFMSESQQILNECDPMFRPMFLAALALGADIERRLISERTKAGLARVKEYGSKSGKAIGRPKKEIDWKRIEEVMQKTGLSRNAVSKFFGYKPSTFYRKLKEKKKKENEKEKEKEK